MTRGMRRLSRFVVCIALATTTGPIQATEQDSASDELLRLNRELFESAILRKDPTVLNSVALEQLVVIAPGGVVEDKSQALAGLRAFDVTSLSIEDGRVAVDDSAAIVVGKLVLVGQIRPMGPIGPLKFMSVFVRENGTWRLFARSLTPCAQAAIAAGRC